MCSDVATGWSFLWFSGIWFLGAVGIASGDVEGDAEPEPLSLECQACQVLASMLFDDVRERLSGSVGSARYGLQAAVTESLNEKLVCRGKRREAWLEFARREKLDGVKLAAACTRLFNSLEEELETVLSLRDVTVDTVRDRVCLKKRKRSALCKRLWKPGEGPVSRVSTRLAAAENAQRAAENQRKGDAFLRENAKRTGVVALKSGLQYKILRSGQDAVNPTMQDQVSVHYRATLIDCVIQPGPKPCLGGTEFDSTHSRGRPAGFTGNIAGSFWVEALPRMTCGDYSEFYVPYQLAYGANDDPEKRPKEVGPNSTLIFSVELLSVKGKCQVAKSEEESKQANVETVEL